MTQKVGDSKIPGSGRKAGTPNKATATLKQAVMEAFDQAGGAKYLHDLSIEDPKTFCTLLARVIPTETHTTLDVTKIIRNFQRDQQELPAPVEPLKLASGD